MQVVANGCIPCVFFFSFLLIEIYGCPPLPTFKSGNPTLTPSGDVPDDSPPRANGRALAVLQYRPQCCIPTTMLREDSLLICRRPHHHYDLC